MKTSECVVCIHKNNAFNAALVPPLIPISVTPRIFWRVHVDLIGKMPVTSKVNEYLTVTI